MKPKLNDEYSALPSMPWSQHGSEWKGSVGRETRKPDRKIEALEVLEEVLAMPAEIELQLWKARAPKPLPRSGSRERWQIRAVNVDSDAVLFPFPVEISNKRLLAQINALARTFRAFGVTWHSLTTQACNAGAAFNTHMTDGTRSVDSTSPPLDLL